MTRWRVPQQLLGARAPAFYHPCLRFFQGSPRLSPYYKFFGVDGRRMCIHQDERQTRGIERCDEQSRWRRSEQKTAPVCFFACHVSCHLSPIADNSIEAMEKNVKTRKKIMLALGYRGGQWAKAKVKVMKSIPPNFMFYYIIWGNGSLTSHKKRGSIYECTWFCLLIFTL